MLVGWPSGDRTRLMHPEVPLIYSTFVTVGPVMGKIDCVTANENDE